MPAVVISAAIEAEVAQLPPEDQGEYLASLGLKETGLARVVRAGYQLLDLVTFFTVGPKEARAWTVRREATAPEAAGVIHTDFEKGFIRAETIAYDDYVTLKRRGGRTRRRQAPARRQGLRPSRTVMSSTSGSTSDHFSHIKLLSAAKRGEEGAHCEAMGR